MNSYKFSHCPWCLSSQIAKSGKITYYDPVEFSNKQIKLQAAPELWRCLACSSGFVQNILPENIAQRLYVEGDSGARWQREPLTKKVLKTLDKWFIPGNHVLDVGCNTGELLDYAKYRGCITAGIELSAASRQVLERKGHKVYYSIDCLPSTYDVITAFDLVEHLYSPRAFLGNCTNSLTSNGVCLFLTGNIECLSSKIAGSDWWYLRHPEHIVFPSKKCLRAHCGMKLQGLIYTHASREYECSILKLFPKVMSLLFKRNYGGLPSIGTDHFLAVLTK